MEQYGQSGPLNSVFEIDLDLIWRPCLTFLCFITPWSVVSVFQGLPVNSTSPPNPSVIKCLATVGFIDVYLF